MTENAAFPEATSPFDAQALVRMGRDVDDRAFALEFATRYRQLLSGRVTRISTALVAEDLDVDVALDATLSLKVSSSTVGTHELAQLALAIEARVRTYDVVAARSVAARLPTAAARADAALAAYLSD